jgi:hypothetical protein
MILAYVIASVIGLIMLCIIGQKLTPISLNTRRVIFMGLLGLMVVWIARYTGLIGSNYIDSSDLLIKTVMILVCVLVALEIELNWISSLFKSAKINHHNI